MTVNVKSDDGFVRVSALEFAAGWVPGHLNTPQPEYNSHPVVALEDALRPALTAEPCVIGFSGGRDSSALLATAVRLARREGLPEPVPVTRRYPGIPESEESKWQELVVRHLAIGEWVRHDIRDELELLGTAAQESLRRFGPLWPATLHNRGPSIAIARGGVYIDGEGGDEVLGEFRITPLTQLVRRERCMNRDAVRKTFFALAPGFARRRAVTGRIRGTVSRPWLQPDVAEWFESQLIADEAERPLLYPAAVRRVASRRAVAVGMHNLDTMGSHLGVKYVHPLLDARFVRALGAWGGRLGHTSRTATMRALFQEMLPDAILAREHKALFNNAYAGPLTRDFLHAWDGTGLDDTYINLDALRRTWDKPTIHGGTFQLIHEAWLSWDGATERPQSDASGA